jgi:hypothetical protein
MADEFVPVEAFRNMLLSKRRASLAMKRRGRSIVAWRKARLALRPNLDSMQTVPFGAYAHFRRRSSRPTLHAVDAVAAC